MGTGDFSCGDQTPFRPVVDFSEYPKTSGHRTRRSVPPSRAVGCLGQAMSPPRTVPLLVLSDDSRKTDLVRSRSPCLSHKGSVVVTTVNPSLLRTIFPDSEYRVRLTQLLPGVKV